MWTNPFGVETWLHKTLFLSDSPRWHMPLPLSCVKVWFLSPLMLTYEYVPSMVLSHNSALSHHLHSYLSENVGVVKWQAIQPYVQCLISSMSLRHLTTHSSPMKMGVKLSNLTWFLWELDKIMDGAQDRFLFLQPLPASASPTAPLPLWLLLLNLVLFPLKKLILTCF